MINRFDPAARMWRFGSQGTKRMNAHELLSYGIAAYIPLARAIRLANTSPDQTTDHDVTDADQQTSMTLWGISPHHWPHADGNIYALEPAMLAYLTGGRWRTYLTSDQQAVCLQRVKDAGLHAPED